MMQMEYTTLDKISENLDSKRKPITSSDRVEGKIPYYGASGIVDYVKDYIFDESLLLVSEDGANLLARSTPIAFSVTGKTWINNHAHVLRFSNENLQKFVEIYLNSISLESYVTGSAQPKLNQKMLNGIPIPVVDDSQIEIIVNSVENLKSIIEFRKQELACLDDLIKARFVEMFGSIYDNKYGYNVMTLQDVCEPIKDGTHQTPTYTEDTVNGFKFLSSKDVTSGKVDWDHLKYIPEELHNELYKRISPRKGDILLAKNGTTGVAAIVDRDEVFDIYVSLALLKPLEMVTAEYLCSAVNSLETKHQFDHSLKGIGVPNLHLGEIKKTKIIVPPIELQKQFADFVHQVDKSKVVVQKALDETQILFNSLMQQYFG